MLETQRKNAPESFERHIYAEHHAAITRPTPTANLIDALMRIRSHEYAGELQKKIEKQHRYKKIRNTVYALATASLIILADGRFADNNDVPQASPAVEPGVPSLVTPQLEKTLVPLALTQEHDIPIYPTKNPTSIDKTSPPQPSPTAFPVALG